MRVQLILSEALSGLRRNASMVVSVVLVAGLLVLAGANLVFPAALAVVALIVTLVKRRTRA